MSKYAIAAVLLISSSAFAQDWGKFSEPLNVELLSSRHDLKLLQDFTYTGPGPQKLFWLAPKGTITDGASIPRLAWSIVGGPLDGQYRKAAIIHDVGCVEQTRTWQDTHRAFYTAMRAAGVGEIQAKVMYAAVYHFGPRWAEPKNILLPRTNTQNFKSQLEMLQADLPLGKRAVLINDGRVVTRTVSAGVFKRERVEEVVGATIEIREIQPPPSEQAFDKMRAEIEQKNLSISEIEELPVSGI